MPCSAQGREEGSTVPSDISVGHLSACETVMHCGGQGIPRTSWPPTDDKPLRYVFGAPLFLNFLWISHLIKGGHNGEILFWQHIPKATSIINVIWPITGAEPTSFKVYADDLLSRWRALRGFRNTLKRRPRVVTVAFDGRLMVKLCDRDGPLGHKRPASMLLFVY